MKFAPISEAVLNQGLDNQKLFLFEIVNKDIKSSTSGNKNIHTKYWEVLFSPKNTKNLVLALNGRAEVFWRPGQVEKLEKKKDKQGKIVLDAKRYAAEKLFFHIPVTINYGKPKILKFKDKVQNFVAENKTKLTYLGIDRGEKHLMYYSLLDADGNIIVDKNEKGIQGSFNTINGVPYHEKLSQRAGNMMEARKNWQTIGNIKNFKEGYVSQVVHEIYQMVIQHNCLIIMEDLNTKFKAKQTAQVEKSVYKKFELALAKKLNHLVLKDKNLDETGGVLHAYQLTPYVGARDVGMFEKSKQWGVL